MAFSYSGLIDQLKFEGYSTDEATYAADNCGANWKEQAVLAAMQYLDTMAFSKDGLIDQLEYEGFTSDEAEYGAEHAYSSSSGSSPLQVLPKPRQAARQEKRMRYSQQISIYPLCPFHIRG